MKIQLKDGYIDIQANGSTWAGETAQAIMHAYHIMLRVHNIDDNNSTLIYFIKTRSI